MIEEGWSLPAFDGPNVHVKAVTEARSLVVCDKHVVACWLNQRNVEERSIAEVTRSSISCVGGALLTREKVEAITSYARHAKVPIAFLGDLDPSALHVFATLRAGGREEFLRSSRPRVDATWIGTDSKWIAWLERRSIDIRSIAVEMHEAQRAHWKVMQALMPDARALIGRRASKLLDEGWQLDIDMIMAHTREPFMHALVRRLQRSQAA